MTRFQRLAVAAAAVTLAPIAMGGVVRATGSGDGCPDWPRCFGSWIPPFEYHALIEYSHRLLAAVSGFVILALVIWLLVSYRGEKWLLWPGLAALPLVLLQAYLGKVVVESGLSPALVTFHLATATLLAGSLVLVAVNAFFFPAAATSSPEVSEPDPISAAAEEVSKSRVRGWSTAAAVSVFVLILIGAYMRAEGASLAFRDWPLMNGSLLPRMGSEPEAVHFAHRVGALVVGLILVETTRRAFRSGNRSLKVTALLSVAFFLAEVMIGAANVWSLLAPWARALHVTFSTLTWGAVVALAALAADLAAGRAVVTRDAVASESRTAADPATVGTSG